MDVGTLTLALLLGLLGLGLIILILYSFWRGVMASRGRFSLRSLSEQWKLKRRMALLDSADEILEHEVDAQALLLLRRAFLIDTLFKDSSIIDQLTNHHLGILSRIVMISERTSRHIPNLPVVEELLLARAELMKAYAENMRAFHGVKARIKSKGRSAPSWAVDEYQKKIEALRESLSTNQKSIEGQLTAIFTFLEKAGIESEVTFH